ncbi:molybdopterin molybdotransferase MoeA [Novispirillum itersonii]|uniref:Molybdopterin molybdenumtransferase n=1 Tax=Novispirillum itersonii TaxID=189 RepID=A0A7X0DMV9_NOVIT|nr:gephyrin-like molybdotransferase Glp [Novispirillum itersonii]MBB6210679.1 molybdopterin molybdotransferase [Novispirillum itersonii]
MAVESSSLSPISADCFAPSQGLLPLEEAWRRIAVSVSPVCAGEDCAVPQAAGRILAEPVVASLPMPPHDNAAMDGYAVSGADLAAARARGEDRIVLPVVRRIAAGDPPGEAVPPGQAVRIFTGAPLPPGLETVVMQEDCVTAQEGGQILVSLPSAVATGDNRRRAGEDVETGQTVLSPGVRLRPADVAMAAAVGRTRLRVFRPLRVALFSTGSELREPGQPLPPGCIHDSNRYGVMAMLRALGCDLTDLGILPDKAPAIRAALDGAAEDHDLVITSGGVSVGEEDHVKGAVDSLGGLHFWKLALKPGRPVALGTVRGAAFLGLPGNPVSALVTLLLIGRPLIHRLQGRAETPLVRYPLPAAFTFSKKPGRQEFIRVWTGTDSAGRLVLRAFPSQSSGVLSSMVQATGLADLSREGTGVREGETLDYIPFTEALW